MKSQKNVRVISFLLVLAMLVSTLMTETFASYKSNWKNWSQGGSELRYASTRADGTYAFRKYGCHFIAQCKLMAESGVVKSSFNPDDYFEWVISCGTKYICGKQPNGSYAIGEKSIGASMIDYAKTKGFTISKVATVSLAGKTANQKKTTIQQYINEGYYVILDCAAHETYVMQGESKAKGTPWISDSGSRYSSVSTSSGIYAYTGTYGGGGGWEAAFTKAYVYSVKSSGEAEPICTNHVKGTYRFAEAAHPHEQYWLCANCGTLFTDHSTKKLESCEICYPPKSSNSVSLTGVKASSITTNSVRLDASCSYIGARPSSVGVYLGTSKTNMTEKGSDKNITHNINPFNIWYNLSGLSAGTTYYYQFYAVASGTKYLSDIKTFTTTAAQTVCTNHVKGKYMWYAEEHPHYDHYECAVCGKVFRDTKTNYVSTCEICNPPKPCNHVKGKYLWYNSAHPHYDYYQCAICGEMYRGTTTNIMPTCEICCPINAYGIWLSGLSATNITANSVKLNASCAYTGSRPTSVGVFLGTGPNSLEIKGSDGGINHNKNPFSIWYNLSGLKAGTTYYYRFYAVVDGKMSYSEIKSFTTSAAR